MIKKINTLIWLVGLLATLMTVPSGLAEAISCDAGNTCIEDLTNTNTTGVTIDIRVTVDNTGATSVLNVAFLSDNIQNTPLGIDQFGYASAVLASILPPGWSQAPCSTTPAPCTMDGFGDLVSEIDNPQVLTFPLALRWLPWKRLSVPMRTGRSLPRTSGTVAAAQPSFRMGPRPKIRTRPASRTSNCRSRPRRPPPSSCSGSECSGWGWASGPAGGREKFPGVPPRETNARGPKGPRAVSFQEIAQASGGGGPASETGPQVAYGPSRLGDRHARSAPQLGGRSSF